MAYRKALSKKTRFEVFKRDSFTCQYCGKKAPEVVLHVDHIKPVADGGDNDLLNLITSCESCNLGKSDRKLSDDAVIVKQSKQLEELQSRREQLEMMSEWQHGLREIENETLEIVCKYFTETFIGATVNENGKMILRSYIKKYPLDMIFEAIEIAAWTYIKFEDMKPTKKSLEFAFDKVSGILHNKYMEKKEPFYAETRFISNTLNKFLRGYDKRYGLSIIKKALEFGLDRDDLIRIANEEDNFIEWQYHVEYILGGHNV